MVLGEKLRIDPWSSTQYRNYARLRDEFGIEEFSAEGLPHPQKLLRRGVVFGHRGFETIREAIINKKRFALMTGVVPSGNMHVGHKMLIDQVIYYQSVGAEVFLAVADIEAWGARGVSLSEAKSLAIEQYITNYIALGLKPDKCQIYFQSSRKPVLDLSYVLARRINLSEMRAIYGFDDATNMTHVFAPLVQVGDILHVQLEQYGGSVPTLVPVGVDQDPHIRLTREVAFAHRLFNTTLTKDDKFGVFVKVDKDVKKLLDAAEQTLRDLGFREFNKIARYKALYVRDASAKDIPLVDEALLQVETQFGGYGFYQPAATYHRLMTGLTGGKMSSSVPESSIFLTDEPEIGAKKINLCKTGGGVSLEEQRKYGGKPEECVVYELFLYHLLEDDSELNEIYEACRGGKQLCGKCKKYASELTSKFLADLREKRALAHEEINEYIRED